MSMGSVIRQRREERHLTQDQVSARVGISKPYLSNVETDKVKNPPSDRVIRRLEQALEFAPGQLQRIGHLLRTPPDIRQEFEKLQGEVEKLQNKLRQLARGGKARPRGLGKGELLSIGKVVPIINRLAAGYPHHFTDLDYPVGVADEYVRAPDIHDPQAFAVYIFGDSMAPRYADGDIVVFAPNREPRSGDDCFVRFPKDDSTTFKRLRKTRDGKIRLEPLNDKYPPQEYDPDDISGLWPAVMRIEKLR